MTQQPQAKYRHDYRAPEYLISDIDLTFDLDAAKTVVTAESKVSRHAAASDVPLRLDGEDLTGMMDQAAAMDIFVFSLPVLLLAGADAPLREMQAAPMPRAELSFGAV